MTDNEHAKADAAAKQQQEAAKKHADETRKKLKEDREAREKASKESAKAVGDVKPTPTQEENDLAAEGVYLAEHEDDGSGPDPNSPEAKVEAARKQIETHKHSEAAKPKSGYQTRAATAS